MCHIYPFVPLPKRAIWLWHCYDGIMMVEIRIKQWNCCSKMGGYPGIPHIHPHPSRKPLVRIPIGQPPGVWIPGAGAAAGAGAGSTAGGSAGAGSTAGGSAGAAVAPVALRHAAPRDWMEMNGACLSIQIPVIPCDSNKTASNRAWVFSPSTMSAQAQRTGARDQGTIGKRAALWVRAIFDCLPNPKSIYKCD